MRIFVTALVAEARSRETLAAMALTGFMVVTIGLLAFHDLHESHGAVVSGIVWTSLAFAASVGLARAFPAEADRGTLDVLLTLPIHRGTVFLGKAAASATLVIATALVVAPAVVVLSEASLGPLAWAGFALLLAMGALGLAGVATLLSALVTRTRSREMLLPVLLLPLVVPLLIATVHGTQDILSGEAFREWRPELLVLLGYDLAFLAAAVPLFETVMET